MSIADRPVVLVARREISEGFRSKGFWILLAVSLVAVAAIITIANLAGGSSESTIDLAVVGTPDPAAVDRYEAIGEAIGTTIDVSTVADDAAARDAVDDGDADVALLEGATAIVVEEPIDADDDSDVATVVNVLRSDIALTQGLTEAGMSSQEIAAARCPRASGASRASTPATTMVDDSRVGTAVIINIALFLLLQTYGGWVVSGVTREKASRVVEVLLSTLTARQLMFGKIIGIGGLALMHAAALVTRRRSSPQRSSASTSRTGSAPSTYSSAPCGSCSAMRCTARRSPLPVPSAAEPRTPRAPCCRSCSR